MSLTMTAMAFMNFIWYGIFGILASLVRSHQRFGSLGSKLYILTTDLNIAVCILKEDKW